MNHNGISGCCNFCDFRKKKKAERKKEKEMISKIYTKKKRR